jgi:hypothetical protein
MTMSKSKAASRPTGLQYVKLSVELLLLALQAGIQLYLQRHALGNGTMPDAVRAIAEALLTRGVQVKQECCSSSEALHLSFASSLMPCPHFCR